MSTPLSVRTALRFTNVPDGPVKLLRDLKLTAPVRLRAVLDPLLAPPTLDLPPGTLALVVGAKEVRRAISGRIAGTGGHQEAVVWSLDGSELVVYAASLQLRITGGFLVAVLEVEAAELPRAPVQLVFFLGTPQAGAGKAASVMHDGETPTRMIEAWGDALRTAVWEGVLDVIEGAAVAASQVAGVPLRVLGFTGGEDRVTIAVGP